MRTPHDATKEVLCPMARTFAASPAQETCRGDVCACWRWERITTTTPGYKEAVSKVAKDLNEKVPFPKAARYVADNLVEFGLVPTKGYCGLGGDE